MRKVSSHETDRLPFSSKLLFGVGGTIDAYLSTAIHTIANQVFNIFLGMNPVLISLVIFLSRLWDAFTDPFMGSVSDNTRSRFGRRRPFILVGGIGAALIYVLMWRFSPTWSHVVIFWWFLLMTLVFYTFGTICSVPYNALSYELSPNYNERTRIMAVRIFFGALAGVSVQWTYRLTQMECFTDTLDGIRTVSIGIALILVVSALLPALFSKERLAQVAQRQQKVPFWPSLKQTFRNSSFVFLIAGVILACLGLFMVGQLGTYINIYHIFGGDTKAASTMLGLGGMLYHLCGGVMAAPLISFLARKFGKKETLLGGLLLGIVGTGTKFWTYTPDNPYLQLTSMLVMSPGLSCLWILTPSIVADICDEDELETGIRREGMYGAVYSNVMKFGMSIGLLLTGFILNLTGFRAELGNQQPEHSLFMMRILYALIPSSSLLLAVACILKVGVSEQKANGIRAQLDARHAQRESDDVQANPSKDAS